MQTGAHQRDRAWVRQALERLNVSPVQPIGIAQTGVIALHHALPHVTLAGALSVWRRRACAIALGRCTTSAYLLNLAPETSPLRAQRLANYADYLKLTALKNAADLADARLADAESTHRAHPTRLWPFHYPVIEPIVESDAFADDGQAPRLGAYIDVIL